MKEVLISINPKWCELIASGKKVVEVRKTRPKLETPFKVYIYCTKGRGDCLWRWNGIWYDTQDPNHRPNRLDGKVIGEFVCRGIEEVYQCNSGWVEAYACIPRDEFFDYLGIPRRTHLGYDKKAYGWLISDLVIYDEPRDLSEFYKPCENLINGFCKLPYPFNPCTKIGMTYERFGKNGEHLRLVEKNACLNVLHRPPQSWCYVESEDTE